MFRVEKFEELRRRVASRALHARIAVIFAFVDVCGRALRTLPRVHSM